MAAVRGNVGTVVLVGATSGLGRHAARQLGEHGYRLLLVGRDKGRGRSLVAEIEGRPGATPPVFIAGDVSTRAGVDGVARAVAAETDHVDVLINNAGVMTSRRVVTDEGMELNFAIHHLAPYSMTAALLPLLARAGGRVINTNSAAHAAALFTPGTVDIDFDDLQFEHRYSPYVAYSRTKLANLLFTFEFTRRVPGVRMAAVHPGMVRTRLVRSMHSPVFWVLSKSTRFLLLRSARTGGLPLTALASTDDFRGGAYYDRFRPAPSSGPSRDRRSARRLWEITEGLRGALPQTTYGEPS
jgi:NAD(P)-dependent dehydrogenase (short-subunit alcohol dehydrogenase family)